MKILVKFPTRSRPIKFIEVLKSYIELSSNPSKINYLVTYDNDDVTMNEEVIATIKSLSKNITLLSGHSANKIHACNRGIETYNKKWDIVVLASDDMICQVEGWDEDIRNNMTDYFPDTDGCLWFWDGDVNTKKNGLCTMNIMGNKYYNRFGYLYHPSYISLWSDNEYTEVGLLLNKIKFIDKVIFRHIHFSNTPNIQPDELMKKTQMFFHIDKANYVRRKEKRFGL